MTKPISENWKNLSVKHSWILIVTGFILEIPVRWIVRPDMGDLVPGNYWFDLPLRFLMDGGMLALFFILPIILGCSFKNIGIPLRRWTRWEWIAFSIIGGTEIIIVTLIAGGAGCVFGKWVYLPPLCSGLLVNLCLA